MLLIAVLTIILGVFGLISPDTVMALRREYVVNAYGLDPVGEVKRRVDAVQQLHQVQIRASSFRRRHQSNAE